MKITRQIYEGGHDVPVLLHEEEIDIPDPSPLEQMDNLIKKGQELLGEERLPVKARRLVNQLQLEAVNAFNNADMEQVVDIINDFNLASFTLSELQTQVVQSLKEQMLDIFST